MFSMCSELTPCARKVILIYDISRDGSKNFNIGTCEHMILGQLRIGARQAKNAPLTMTTMTTETETLRVIMVN